MKEDKKKIGLFDDLSFVKMTDEEFDQWAENHVKTYNSFVKSYKSGDPNSFVSETGNSAFELMPLIIVKLIFSGEEIREVTKEEVLEKYSYLRDTKYLSDLTEILKDYQMGGYFKDGDILTTELGTIFILKEPNKNDFYYSCYIALHDKLRVAESFTLLCAKKGCRLATEEEKQLLFGAIKANGYIWNADKRKLEEIKKTEE